jgi:hypothetical protein
MGAVDLTATRVNPRAAGGPAYFASHGVNGLAWSAVKFLRICPPSRPRLQRPAARRALLTHKLNGA